MRSRHNDGGCVLARRAGIYRLRDDTRESSARGAKATPLGIWGIIVQTVLINAIPVGQIIGRLRDTLKELQRHHQHLESLVDQRTHELVQARDQAESLNRAKSAFSSPMMRITNFIRLSVSSWHVLRPPERE